MFNPVPKPKHNRRVPKQKDRNKFSEETIKAILERDDYQCVRCGSYHLEAVPHHIRYRSEMGGGKKSNGASVCVSCHQWAHKSKKKNNEWFTRWADLNLDTEGNKRFDVYKNPDIFQDSF